MSLDISEALLRVSAEAVLLALAFWVMLSPMGGADHLRRLGAPRVISFSILLILWIAIQLADRAQFLQPRNAGFYPGARFAMYDVGTRRHVVRSYRLVAYFADGGTRELVLADIFPSVDAQAIETRMRAVSAGLESADPSAARDARRQLEGYVAGVRSVLRSRDEPVPRSVTFHATRHRISDRALVHDTVLWHDAEGRPGAP